MAKKTVEDNNTLTDLNNLLFAEIRAVADTGLTGGELKEELQKAKAMSQIASEIVKNSSLQLNAIKFQVENAVDKDVSVKKLLDLPKYE